MKIFDQSDLNVPRLDRGLALGFFDGVHRGHCDLIRTLIFNCGRLKLESAVFTFNEHPFTEKHELKRQGGYITTLAERLELFSELGVAEVHHYEFSADFSHLEPSEFLSGIIIGKLNAKLLVVGADYRFGYHGAGDVNFLRQWCQQHAIELIVVDDVELYGQKISSTSIRQLIGQGDMQKTSSLLGRPFTLYGEVVAGRKLGRTLGFPTANFSVKAGRIEPGHGVYATRTKVGERTWWSITNYGIKPTVEKTDDQPVAETYIYDEKIDLYGQEIEVQFLHKLRDEKKFPSLLQLVTQINQDLQAVYQYHKTAEESFVCNYVNSIPVHLIPSIRFTQNALLLAFSRELEPKSAAIFALLLQVLTAGCRRFPEKKQLATELDRLYSSSIDSHVEKHGNLQILYLSAQGLNKWTDGSRPFAETCRLLFDLLFDPLLDQDGFFDGDIIESERQSLITELKARQNDKAKFAFDRSLELYCGDQSQGIKATGSIEELAAVTALDLKQAYQELLHNLPAMVSLGGRIDSEQLEDVFVFLGKFSSRRSKQSFALTRPAVFSPQKAQIVLDEYRPQNQARVNLILSGLPPYFSYKNTTASLLNNILGGDVHSLLFDIVREKMGLAYSVYSLHSRYLSSLFVIAGIASEKIDQALAAIKEQVLALASGQIDPQLLETSRQLLVSAVEASHDNLGSMLISTVNATILGRSLSRKDRIDLLNNVSIEDITQMALELEIAVQYCLLPEQE